MFKIVVSNVNSKYVKHYTVVDQSQQVLLFPSREAAERAVEEMQRRALSGGSGLAYAVLSH